MAADRLTRGRRAAAIAAILLAAACDSPSVPTETWAYDPTQLSGGSVFHWEIGRTIAIWTDATSQPAGYDIAAAVRQGAAMWDDTPFYGEFAFRFVDDPHDADVIVRYRQAPRVVDDEDCDAPVATSGRTIFCPEEPEAPVLPLLSDGGGHVKVDIVLDPLYLPDAILAQRGVTRQQAFPILAAHELGHALGIGGHSPNPDDVMNSIPTARRVSADDAMTLRWVLRQAADILL